jgi:hypothetical protein
MTADEHAELIDAGWRTRIDGRWQSPDPTDPKAHTAEAAWHAHASKHRNA